MSASDSVFPGVSDICQEIQSWDWIYGKVPKFHLTHTTPHGQRLNLSIEKGRIVGMEMTTCGGETFNLTDVIRDVPFCPVTLSLILRDNKEYPELCTAVMSLVSEITQ